MTAGTRLRAVPTSKRPCQLLGGELRRVPQDRSFRGVLGYHVGCPRCGFVTAAIAGDEGLRIEERDEVVSFSEPVRCVFCRARLHLREGEIQVEEGPDVRYVRYR